MPMVLFQRDCNRSVPAGFEEENLQVLEVFALLDIRQIHRKTREVQQIVPEAQKVHLQLVGLGQVFFLCETGGVWNDRLEFKRQ